MDGLTHPRRQPGQTLAFHRLRPGRKSAVDILDEKIEIIQKPYSDSIHDMLLLPAGIIAAIN
jgi:hypothetical protein